MAAPDFPLRWESSGDQWWYASPIDWAAANGYYDLVRELLRQDANLLIKLTSLRRIRRLETVWEDDSQSDAARCRALVARCLFRDCETRDGNNTLIRAGYGGWLLYAAAAAGDVDFVNEILHRDPLLVFGEGEYGVTDVLYAAARSGNCEIFRVLYDHAGSPRCWGGSVGEEVEEQQGSGGGKPSVFRWEMLNRAVHAAARGGNLKILREFLGDCSDVLAYKDGQGSTLLHAASGRGQVQVVEDLIKSFDVINSKDNQGNTALHVAAYRGHLSVVKALILVDPSSIFETNNGGDTFLHMAVTGFKSPGFRRLDKQIELMKNLADGSFVNLSPVINLMNNDGRTALHIAVTGNTHSNLVELLMSVPSINLNIRDNDGMTPLDLLNLRPRSASSGILIKELISAGGISNMKDYMTRNAIASQLKMQGICGSPGTSFRISDSEILLYTGMENASEISGDRESTRASTISSPSKSELSIADNISTCDNLPVTKRSAAPSVSNAAKHLKALLGWSRRREKKTNTTSADSMKMVVDTDSLNSCRKFSFTEDIPIPLRLRYTNASSLPNNKRALAMETSLPSASTKEKFTAGLVQGVIQSVPNMNCPTKTSSRTPLPSSPGRLNKHGDSMSDGETGECSLSKLSVDEGTPSETSNKMRSLNNRLMNEYFCFGAQGLNAEEPVPRQHSDSVYKQSALSVA